MKYQQSDPQDWVFPTRTTLQREVLAGGVSQTLVISKRNNQYLCHIKGFNELEGYWTDTSKKGLQAFKTKIAEHFGGGRWKIVTEEVGR